MAVRRMWKIRRFSGRSTTGPLYRLHPIGGNSQPFSGYEADHQRLSPVFWVSFIGLVAGEHRLSSRCVPAVRCRRSAQMASTQQVTRPEGHSPTLLGNPKRVVRQR